MTHGMQGSTVEVPCTVQKLSLQRHKTREFLRTLIKLANGVVPCMLLSFRQCHMFLNGNVVTFAMLLAIGLS
jgi:sulfite exporter TauE/SafE